MTPIQRMLKLDLTEPTIKKVIKEADRRMREMKSSGERPETVYNLHAFKRIDSPTGKGGEFEINVLYSVDCATVDMVCIYFDSFACLTIDNGPVEFWSESKNKHCMFNKHEWLNDSENPTQLELETLQILFGADFTYVFELFDSMVETFIDDNGMINTDRVHIS